MGRSGAVCLLMSASEHRFSLSDEFDYMTYEYVHTIEDWRYENAV